MITHHRTRLRPPAPADTSSKVRRLRREPMARAATSTLFRPAEAGARSADRPGLAPAAGFTPADRSGLAPAGAAFPAAVERPLAVQHPIQRQQPDPIPALARVRRVRGQRVLLERDLASALGTLAGRLSDMAARHADWFPESARFALAPEECVQQGIWYTRSGPEPLDWKAHRPLAPVVYTLEGLVAAAHWLASEAERAGDPYSECADLTRRFRTAWLALAEEQLLP